MPKRSTAQKKARALQAETGRPYRSCLQEVLGAQAERTAAEPEPDTAPAMDQPTSGGLLAHT